MTDVVNERDVTMRRSPARTVAVTPPNEAAAANISITLLSDVAVWTRTPPGSPWRSNNASLTRETLTVILKDIPANNPVTWKVGAYTKTWSEAKQAYVLTSFVEQDIPTHGIVLRGTGNLTRTIEMTDYPSNLSHPSVVYGRMTGGVRVSTTHLGIEYVDLKAIEEIG